MPPQACQAAKALVVPEILENVLRHLSIAELFAANAVNSIWRDLISTSPTLQRHLQLLPDPSASFEDRVLEWEAGLKVQVDLQYLATAGQVGLSLMFTQQPKLSMNMRSCLVTKLPLTVVKVAPRCCEEDKETVANSTGITLGALYDTSKKIVAEHENCPKAMAKACTNSQVPNADGVYIESYWPVFSGLLDIPETHVDRVKAVKAHAEKKREWAQKEAECEPWRDIWYEYRRASRRAAAVGQDLPKWPAFLAANQHLAPI